MKNVEKNNYSAQYLTNRPHTFPIQRQVWFCLSWRVSPFPFTWYAGEEKMVLSISHWSNTYGSSNWKNPHFSLAQNQPLSRTELQVRREGRRSVWKTAGTLNKDFMYVCNCISHKYHKQPQPVTVWSCFINRILYGVHLLGKANIGMVQ